MDILKLVDFDKSKLYIDQSDGILGNERLVRLWYWQIRECFGQWVAMKLRWAIDQSEDVLANERELRLGWSLDQVLNLFYSTVE